MTHPWAFQVPGGGERILLDCRAQLIRLGCAVELFDPWHHQFKDFDIVHYFHSPGWDSWERIKNAGCRLVVTPTLWWDPPPGPWLVRQIKQSIHRLLEPWWCPPIDERTARRYLMIPDLLLPTSSLEMEGLHQHLHIPREKMMAVRNAANVEGPKYQLSTQIEEALAEDRSLLCVGSFHRVKNQLGLIRALEGSDFRVVFVGAPYLDDADSYLHLCQEAAKGRHWFFPSLPHEGVLAAMQRARVYVQPSYRETCGLAALEAGALGCEVVITSIGATREYFANHAWYIDPSDPSSIRNAVEKAWAAGPAAALRNHILENFTYANVGQSLLRAYELVRERA